ncbi:MAG: type II and III secretion system family protein [Micavibrio aeruginosavorus]|uniref:Type II and III secretion system family protein n=1 Tax=Micavibrio aeruginosavorus TaxID=349221 RepID=A0A2W5PRX1_9BACT|nr:MAG: type II and III secretion system family protein [Micavibrio aeruginosavorus]
MTRKTWSKELRALALSAVLALNACAWADTPGARNVKIPSPTSARERETAINERPDSVMYLPLGEDVLVPEVMSDDAFPSEMVGPFELRGETLAGALQLILADYDISLAFETQEGLSRRITVANLRGDLGKVVHQVCSLANLYCSYEDGTITVKDRQTFTVTLPPLGSADDQSEYLDDVAEGLSAIIGEDEDDPIVDPTTRTIVYAATQRTADVATRYFQRLRANTAMIVFETYIWEVALNSGNTMGVDWFKLAQFGKFNSGISIDGETDPDFLRPVSIGIPTASEDFNGTSGDLIRFLSQFGAVKTISQPQITVLSGSEAELRVADTQNYVSQIATTIDEGQATTSVSTDSVDTGFTLTIGSSWDKATVYANVAIELTNVNQIQNFAFATQGEDGGSTQIQLPQTSERQLSTQIRVRPGDSVLIAGLVRENDNYDDRGIGFMKPIIPDSRTSEAENLELVILLRPRVVVYTANNDSRYIDYAAKKHKLPGTGVKVESPKELGEPVEHKNVLNPGQPYDAPATRSIYDANKPVVPAQETIPEGIPAPLTSEPLSAAPVVPTTPAPVTSTPLAPIPPRISPAPVANAQPVPITPPVQQPSWQGAPATMPTPATPTPILKPGPSALAPSPTVSSDSRFQLGNGIVSKSNAPLDTSPATSSVTTYPLPVPTPAVTPVAPAPTRGGSLYETYDYYTPQ